VTVETNRSAWVARIEEAIRGLRDAGVEGVYIQTDEDEIREIHILSTSRRPAKMLVRDVQTLLATRFNTKPDHRVISVAYVAPGEAAPRPAETRAPEAPEPAPAAEPQRRAAPPESRIRFEGVNVYVSGPKAHAQVELNWKGLSRMGSASGWSTREAAHRLIASATLAAVKEFLDEDLALSVDEAQVVRLGREDVIVVSLALLTHRQQKTLAGCCSLGGDAQQAVVLATLAALNRVVGGLRTKEPTEYVLRPASS
jgi:hypothetical protein